MKNILPLLLAVILVAGCVSAESSRVPDVLVVADVFTPDKTLPEPTADEPVYYYFIGGLERDIGGSIAGLPSPSAEEIRGLLSRELARRHFIETKVGGPLPAIAIVCSFGTAFLDTFEQNDTDYETGETTTSILAFNEREMYQLLGIFKASQRLMSGTEVDNLNDALNSDRFYIMVAALDVPSLLQRKKKLLWRTRISIDAHRTTLPDSMDLMIASAAPYFGKEESRPVFVDDNLRRKVEVEVGEATVIESDVPPPEGG